MIWRRYALSARFLRDGLTLEFSIIKAILTLVLFSSNHSFKVVRVAQELRNRRRKFSSSVFSVDRDSIMQ
jgi:hypothetical protein